MGRKFKAPPLADVPLRAPLFGCDPAELRKYVRMFKSHVPSVTTLNTLDFAEHPTRESVLQRPHVTFGGDGLFRLKVLEPPTVMKIRASASVPDMNATTDSWQSWGSAASTEAG